MKVQRVSPVCLEAIQLMVSIPSGPHIDAHEAIVRRGLPVLDAVEAAQSDEERMQAYSILIAKQRADFIQSNDDAYGARVDSPKIHHTKSKVGPISLAAIMLGAA